MPARRLRVPLIVVCLFLATAAVAQPIPELSDSLLDFGSLPYSGFATDSFFLRNTGDALLVVGPVSVDDFVHYSVDPNAFAVAPGDSQEVTVTFTPGALGVYPATVTIVNFNATPDTMFVQLAGEGGPDVPDIFISADSVTADVFDGFTATDTFQLVNQGGGTLSWMIDEQPEASHMWVLPWIGTSTFGVSRDIVVYFDGDGASPGFYETNLIITSNDPDTPVDTVYISMYVDATPEITAIPQTVEFDETWLGYTHDRDFVIRNTGDGILDVSDILSSSPEFTVDHTTAAILSGERDTVTVTFTPTTSGVKTEQLTISSDDPNNDPYIVSLQAFVDPDAPPEISVVTDTIKVSLFAGELDSVVVSVGNTGPDTLLWSLTLEGSTADPLDGLRILVDESHTPWSDFTNNTTFINAMEALGAQFLFASGLNELVLNYHDVLIIPVSGTVWSNPEISMVADWVVAGGSVLSSVREWPARGSVNSMFSMAGSSLYHASWSTSGTFEYLTTINPHPITQGVDSVYVSENDGRINFVPNDQWLTRNSYPQNHSAWDDVGGRIVAMTQPVWENAQLSQPGQDNLQFITQTLEWLARATGWLSADISSGSVLSGASTDVTLYLDATNVLGGTRVADVVFSSNDPVTPEVRVPVEITVTGVQTISLSDTTLDFGTRYLGQQSFRSLGITNGGTGILNISDITLPDTNFVLGPWSTPVAPGDTQYVDITFAPTEEKLFSVPLTIVSDATNGDTVVVDIAAAGLSSLSFHFDPDSIAVTMAPNDTLTLPVDVLNAGIKTEPVGLRLFDGAAVPLLYENFEDLDFGAWVSTGGPGTWSVEGEVVGANASIYYLQVTDTQLGHKDGRYALFPAVQPDAVSAWINPMQTDKAVCYIRVQDALDRDVIFFLAEGNGTFYVNGNVGGHSSYAYTADTWYHVEFRNFDWVGKTFDYVVNDVVVQAAVPMRNAVDVTEVSRIDIYNYAAAAGGRWDDITVTWGGGPSWAGHTPLASLPPDTPVLMDVSFDTNGLAPGTYNAVIAMTHNADTEPVTMLPLVLTVDPAVTGVGDRPEPLVTSLRPNVPNPFNPVTTIGYEVADAGPVEVTVYSVRGERVTTLVSRDHQPGRYTLTWDGTDARGERVASGVYFYRMTAKGYLKTRKMVLLK